MANVTREPILKLDTLVERRVVAVDGECYELMNASELSILSYHRIGNQGKLVQEMMEQEEDLSDEQIKTLSGLLDSMCKVFLLAPNAVHEKLGDNHKLAVLNTFTHLQQETVVPPAGDEEVVPPQTGENISPD